MISSSIFVDSTKDVSRVHCTFEIHETTGMLMLHDRSITHSTQTFGDNAAHFEPGRLPRRILVTPSLNREFGFGGYQCDRFRFRIVWHQQSGTLANALQPRLEAPCDGLTGAIIAETEPPSQRITRIHTSTTQQVEIRWWEKIVLGHGTFGTVSSAINVDTGNAIAVKVMKFNNSSSLSSEYKYMKREVETLAGLKHVRFFSPCCAPRLADG